jgi:hypothetical protein
LFSFQTLQLREFVRRSLMLPRLAAQGRQPPGTRFGLLELLLGELAGGLDLLEGQEAAAVGVVDLQVGLLLRFKADAKKGADDTFSLAVPHGRLAAAGLAAAGDAQAVTHPTGPNPEQDRAARPTLNAKD